MLSEMQIVDETSVAGYVNQMRYAIGKAAFGTPTGNAWSGHEAYQRSLGSDNGSTQAKVDIMGKAAFAKLASGMKTQLAAASEITRGSFE